MSSIKKILVANRGEIAVRVMRTAKEMGIKTVAVFSEADRGAMHVQLADEAYLIGPAASSESYLNTDKILEVAKKSNADAIHPGYGFLSENAAFTRLVEKNNIIFIGPSADAMDIMGSKLAAKEAVAKYDVPMVPGTESAVSNVPEAKKIAAEIGYPILIKASAGGGGKGMRVVNSEKDFESSMERASNEAQSSFGDGSVFIEKYITSPRHIEIQVLGDKHGNIIHLVERECSVQRRHQKVIEEAPSSVLTEKLRQEIGECAVDVAKSCNYYNAGTVEFLIDDDLNFYFLEMNTRLQVEHPVTELITGLDLVREQINVASGKKLSIEQKDVTINGHAIECRVYAEDPSNNFLPDIGTLTTYKLPEGPGVRVDNAYIEGMEIPIHYDPMMAKLITWGANRIDCIQRMKRAIDEYNIGGVETTLSFCKFAIGHKAFIEGNYNTHFVSEHFKPVMLVIQDEDLGMVAAILAAEMQLSGTSDSQKGNKSNNFSSWRRNRNEYN
ncbi:MAG: acetyl-CoA carboxylase biotin carboxylase subunit [Bacteroidia bacterium]|nr:acetyl-CoA carboxylase biotin carboxylase subunit [Bacteroidia bacterium]NNC85324.1 acetyl-CoA carboxylase biotin carboxylase subunit [Bacteroidia bacterium]NNM16089.1 acetyl-CoA carboxylase biotin carboxylase subunit [Bacteroidia bacterium]